VYGYEASTANATSKVTAVLKAPTKASMALALNGVTLENKANATWLSGVNYLTVNTEYGTTKLLYVVEVTKTGTSIGSLTVTSEDGTETGDTKLTVAGSRLAGTSLVYTVSDTSIDTPTLDDVLEGWTAWDGTSDITVAHGKYVGVAEVLHNGMVKSFGQVQADSDGTD
jgi:hypothetical protein